MTLKQDLSTLDRLTDGEADNLRTAIRQGDLPSTQAFTWAVVLDSWRQMPEDIQAHYGDPATIRAALGRITALVGEECEVTQTYTLPDYEALGQTAEEIGLLAMHDRDEVLHPFVALLNGDSPFCKECGDTEEGLMHNNTYRNVEPLLQEQR